jgi:stress responsive alpha/beta barrel protein
VIAGRIRHTVAFTLAHHEGSAEERDFLEAAERLGAIPGVEAFELLSEVSPKNGYRFGLSMEFADRAAYEGYNQHPDHVRFVQDRWLAEVSDFLELDYVSR